MKAIAELFTHSLNADANVLVGTVKVQSLDKDEAELILSFIREDSERHGAFSSYILDVSAVTKVTNPILGVLMKTLGTVKKVNGYLILVMSETLLQEIMLEHPEMFDYYAVFHTIKDAIQYVRKHAEV